MSECNDCSFRNGSYDPPYNPFEDIWRYRKNQDQFDSIASSLSVTGINAKIIKMTKVIWNDDAVIVFWSDKTKTVVKRMESDNDDIYAAVAQAMAKKIYGGTGKFHSHVNKVLKDYTIPMMLDKNSTIMGFKKFWDGVWNLSHPKGTDRYSGPKE